MMMNYHFKVRNVGQMGQMGQSGTSGTSGTRLVRLDFPNFPRVGKVGNGFSPEGKKKEGQPFGRPGVGILFSSLVIMPVYFLMLGISRP